MLNAKLVQEGFNYRDNWECAVPFPDSPGGETKSPSI